MAQIKDVLGKMVEKDKELKLKVKRVCEDAVLPTKGTLGSAGLDLYSCNDVKIFSGKNAAIHTGIAMEIPEGYVGLLFVRSGLACKQLLRPANCVGVIDEDYRGEVILNLYNDNTYETIDLGHLDYKLIHKGDKVGQIVLVPYISPKLVECDELSDTYRNDGGFGSTGM